MQILFISGFLGAGKSRFISTMSERLGRKFVIVENEFASINIDKARLKSTASMDIYEISSGCICCSLKTSFASSVLTIANTLDPDILVIEPSGVANMSEIIKELKGILYEQISLLAPIAIVNAQNYEALSKDYEATFRSSLDCAGVVILSFSEHLSEQEFLEIKKSLNIASDVIMPLKHYESFNKVEWQRLLELKYEPNKEQRFKLIKKDKISLKSLSFRGFEFSNWAHLIGFMQLLNNGAFGKVQRAKANYKELIIDANEKQFFISGAANLSEPELVIIGQNLKEELIKQALNIF